MTGQLSANYTKIRESVNANTLRQHEMSNSKFEISPEDIMSGAVIPPSMLEGLHVVANLDPEQIGKISHVISELDGLSENDEVESLIASVLPDDHEGSVGEIYKIVKSVSEEDVPKIIDIVQAWANRKDYRKDTFPDSLIAKLKSNLESLVDKSGSIDLIKKADRLARDTSNELESLKFICDLRPVFDDERESVQALVLLANLRIRYVRQNGEKGAFELALTEQELKQIKEKSEEAISKMEVLKKVSTTLETSSPS